MQEDKKENRKPIITWFILFCGILLISLNIFRWDIVDVLTPFIEPFLEMFAWLLFLIVGIWSLVRLLIRIKKEKFRAAIPFMIFIFLFLFIYFVPFTTIMLDIDFYSNISQREKVVQMIKNGEIKVNYSTEDDLIILPEKYKHLSKGGGEIIVSKKGEMILFYTYRGILDDFSGFIYKSNNEEPSKNEFNEDFKEFKKYKQHWYWGTSF